MPCTIVACFLCASVLSFLLLARTKLAYKALMPPYEGHLFHADRHLSMQVYVTCAPQMQLSVANYNQSLGGVVGCMLRIATVKPLFMLQYQEPTVGGVQCTPLHNVLV
jgi:hypothetical protein